MFTPALPLELHASTASETEVFIARLVDMPLHRWPAPAELPAAFAAASAALDAVIADRRLQLAAWHVRDLVETSAFLAEHCAPEREPGARRGEAARRLPARRLLARRLAETAALALLVRPLLPVADFEALYGPFTFLLPRRSRRAGAALGGWHDVTRVRTRG